MIAGSDAPLAAPIAGIDTDAALLSILMALLRSNRCAPSSTPRRLESSSTAGRLKPTTRNIAIASAESSGDVLNTE